MHDIIRDGAVESQFAPENYGSRHCCASQLLMQGSLNECIDCVITHNDSHYFEFSQLFDQINLHEFSEVDCISDSED
jgi:hypothetical protein